VKHKQTTTYEKGDRDRKEQEEVKKGVESHLLIENHGGGVIASQKKQDKQNLRKVKKKLSPEIKKKNEIRKREQTKKQQQKNPRKNKNNSLISDKNNPT